MLVRNVRWLAAVIGLLAAAVMASGARPAAQLAQAAPRAARAASQLARAPHTAPRTIATVYEAFSYHGVVIPNVQVQPGYCAGSSTVTLRFDAWRCFVGNTILDPCFSSEFASNVVCPVPWNDSGVEINLTRPLPKPTNHAVPSLKLAPWAISIASGSNCTFTAGATSVIPKTKTRMNYFCNPKLGLWGYPNRKSTTWTILSAPPNAKTLSHRTAIVHAWM